MKKTRLLGLVLLSVAFLIFSACSNSSGGGGGSSGSSLPKMDVSEFNDCTQSVTDFEITDGTNWSVKFEGDDSLLSRASQSSPEYKVEIDATAAYSGNDFSFTSAKFTQIMKTKDCMAEGYEEYKQSSGAEREFWNMMIMSGIASAFTSYGIGDLDTANSSMDENYLKIVYTLSPTYLQEFEAGFKAAIAQSNRNIKTNEGRNKYILKASGESYYIKQLP